MLVLILNLVVQLFITVLLAWLFFSSAHSSFGGAPFVPMGARHVEPLLRFAQTKTQDVLYDLGCGDGRVLMCAVKDFSISRAVGYDISRFPLVIARWRFRRTGLSERIELRRGDARHASVAPATLIYMYLYPGLTNELAQVLAPQIQPGTRILCPMFPINLQKNSQYRLIKEGSVGTITAYLYERT